MKNIKLILVFSCSFSVLYAQTPLSAKDAVFYALANNYEIQVSHMQVDIAEKNNSWGEAGLFPTVQLGVSFNNAIQDNRNNPFTFTPGVIMNQSLSPSISANWNIFSGFLVKISKERLELLEEQSKGNALSLIETTTQDVIKAYYSAQLQKERMELYKKVMAISSKRKQLYTLKEKYAATSSLELMQFNNQYLTDSTNYLLQEISYNNSIRNLLLLMNQQDSTITTETIVLTDSLNFDFPLIDKDEIISLMLSNNQNLKNQYLNIELQKKQTELRKSFLYPTISLSLGASPNYSWLQDLNNDEFKIQTQTLQYYGNVNLRYTLFDNWKNQRAIQVSKIQETIASVSTESMQRTLVNTLENLIDMYQLRSNLLSISEENLEYATKAWELAQRRFELGTINSVDLTTFQNNFQNTLIQHYENLYNKLETYLEIYRMSGNLGLDFVK